MGEFKKRYLVLVCVTILLVWICHISLYSVVFGIVPGLILFNPYQFYTGFYAIVALSTGVSSAGLYYLIYKKVFSDV